METIKTTFASHFFNEDDTLNTLETYGIEYETTWMEEIHINATELTEYAYDCLVELTNVWDNVVNSMDADTYRNGSKWLIIIDWYGEDI